MQTEHVIMSRMEIVQDVIDRLLYLPENDKNKFLDNLNKLFNLYAIDVEVVGGVRIYKNKSYESKRSRTSSHHING